MSTSNAFVSSLGKSQSPFYLSSLSGNFFQHIAQRIGSNAALDAAVQGITSAHNSLMVRDSALDARIKYGRALNAMRKCLKDPEHAITEGTLCAIYLLTICQGWVGRQDLKYGSHAEGMCHVLNAFAASYNWPSLDFSRPPDFGFQLIVACSMTVLAERISNSRVQLGPWLSNLMGPHGPRRRDLPFLPSMTIRSIDQITKYLQDPALHRFTMEVAYRDLFADVTTMKVRLAELDQSNPLILPIEDFHLPATRLMYTYCVQYGMVLPFAALINYLLQSFPPRHGQPEIRTDDAEFYVEEIRKLGDRVQCFRPLGTEWVYSTLYVAWATTSDVSKQTQLEGMIKEYNTDIPGANSMPVASLTRKWLKNQREKLSGANIYEDVLNKDTEFEEVLGPAWIDNTPIKPPKASNRKSQHAMIVRTRTAVECCKTGFLYMTPTSISSFEEESS